MSECKSCVGCKFLFGWALGYSNYTVEDTDLPDTMPDAWGANGWVGVDGDPTLDKWVCTKNSRCEMYQPQEKEFERVRVDVDQEEFIANEESARGAFLQGDVMPLLVLKYVKGES
jgi:hypothetical protein